MGDTICIKSLTKRCTRLGVEIIFEMYVSKSNADVDIDDDVDDDSIVFLEERNIGGSSSNLPHLRANCTIHKFTNDRKLEFCENCYCYVCDIRTSDCKFWANHCHATNEGNQKARWKKYKDEELERRRIAEGKPKKKMKTILSFFRKDRECLPMQIPPKASTSPSLTDAESYSPPTEGMNLQPEKCCSSNIDLKPDASIIRQELQLPQVVSIADVFQWAVFEGLRSFNTGNILIPPQPNDRNIGPYRFVYCRICNNHHSSIPWAVPKYRKYETALFRRHAESPKHLMAISTNNILPAVFQQ